MNCNEDTALTGLGVVLMAKPEIEGDRHNECIANRFEWAF